MSLGAVSLANQDVLRHAQRTVEEAPQQLQDFNDVLSRLDGGSVSADAVAGADRPTLDIDQLQLPDDLQGVYAEQREQLREPGGGERLLAEAQDKYNRLGELIGELGSGRTFSPEELVGVQSEVHRITFELEATTKVMSEVVSGVKNLMQQQI